MDKCQKQIGFTLIEILIVIVILGILAIVIVPQLTVSTEYAKLQTTKTNLRILKEAIGLYHLQHNNAYPGDNNISGNPASNTGLAKKAFLQQLTRYTNTNGSVSDTKDATYKFGPYLKSDTLPQNPFNEDRAVTCDITTTDITARVSGGGGGWKFYTQTGVLMANDGGHDDL